ncbi:DUF4233 domain-containing protein [Streptomyces sodiiphilus]|uniref:DUF4233 domain-containing protein n=1 Tax=Streptomyces sodiiphilus TaxID=226217 RepID=A0ABP5A4A0_9ACTN
MRTLCAATLIAEMFVIALAALVVVRLGDAPAGTVWTVSGIAMALCVLLSGMIGRPGAVQLGWALQAGVMLSGFVVPVMFFLGACFAGLWWASVHYGRVVDRIKDERAVAMPRTAVQEPPG